MRTTPAPEWPGRQTECEDSAEPLCEARHQVAEKLNGLTVKKERGTLVSTYCPSDISQEIESRKPTSSRATTRKSWYWSGGTGAGIQNFALSSPPKHCKIRLSLRKKCGFALSSQSKHCEIRLSLCKNVASECATSSTNLGSVCAAHVRRGVLSQVGRVASRRALILRPPRRRRPRRTSGRRWFRAGLSFRDTQARALSD